MRHFAQIDENNLVQQVLVIEQDEINTGNWGDPKNWIETSYDTREGIYYTPGTNTPDPDQSKALRKNFAGIGMVYLPNGPDGEGFSTAQPYPSWTLDSFSYGWNPPVPVPTPNPPFYCWDESTLSWVLSPNQPPVVPSNDNPGSAPDVIG